MRFFRTLFLALLFANLGFFAWGQGYFGARETGREPQRLANQIAPEKLQIVAAGSAAAAVAPASTTAKPAVKEVCRVVTGLPPAEVDAFKAALAGLGGGIVVEITAAEAVAPSYWVNIPPLANKAAAEKKAGELRALGVKDFYIVEDEGPSRHAISLGLFKSEAAANEFLQGVAKRGVRSARLDVRTPPVPASRAVVKGAGDVLEARLPELMAKIPGTVAVECP